MADKPKTAAEYLAQAQQNAQVKVRPAASSGSAPIIPFNKTAQAREGTQDPLSWLIDIATRPLSGVTNTVQSVVDRAVDTSQKFSNGDILGGIGNIAKQVSQAVIPTDFLEGMLQADPEKHRTFSEVIEQSTDKFGSLDPNYVDRQDNVSPVLKGTLGLVGDIALDPLTWIPGAQVAKVGGLVAKGAKLSVTGGKSALDALSGATKTAKIVDDATTLAGRTATKIEKPTVEGVVKTGAERSVLDMMDPESRAIYQAHDAELSKMDNATFESALDESLRSGVAKDLGRQIATPEGQALAKGLDAIGPMEIQDIRRVPGVSAKTVKPATLRTNAEVRGPDGAPSPGWVEQIADTPVEQLDFFGTKAPAVLNMAKAAVAGDARALSEMEKLYTKAYLPQFAQAKQQGKIMGANFRSMEPMAARTIKGATTVLDSLGNFRRQLAQDEAAVTARFGKPLTEALARFDSAPNFDKAVSRIKGILDQSIDVTTLRRLTPTDVAALRQLGIPADAIPLGLKPLSAANKVPFPEGSTLTEQVAKAGGEGAEQTDAVRFAAAALNKTIFRDLDRANLAITHTFETKTGVLRTADKYGAGDGRIRHEANTYFQYNLASAVTEAVSSFIKRTMGKSIGGISLAQMKRGQVMAALRLAERGLDESGVPLTIGVGPQRIPISTSQILDILDRVHTPVANAYSALDRVAPTLWAVFNYDTAVPWTNLSDAVYSAVSGGDRAQIEKTLRQVITRHTSADGRVKPLPNNMIQGGGRFGLSTVLDSDQMIAKLTDLIDRARPVFNQVVADNASAYGARGIDETLTITDTALSNLEALKATPGATGQLLEAIADTSSRVIQIAKDFGMMKTSKDLAEAVIDSIIPLTDQIIAKGSTRIDDILRNSEAAEEAQGEAAKIAQKVHEDILENEPGIAVRDSDYGDQIQAAQTYSIFRKVHVIFSRRAAIGSGDVAKQLHEAVRMDEGVQVTLLSKYSSRLNDIVRQGETTESLANKLVNARNGAATTDALTLEFRKLWGAMFDTGKNAGSLIGNRFFTNGNNIHHLNAMFESKGLDKYLFNLDDAARVSQAEGISVMEAAARQSSSWVIDDPLDTMSRMYQSFVFMQGQQTLTQQFVKISKDLGMRAASAKPGFSRAVDTSGKSMLIKYLPKDAYFPDEVLDMFYAVDRLTQESMDLKGPLGTFIREVYQPLQQAWKYGMTLPNPTHHVRNGVSDASLQYYALGTKGAKRSFKAAAQAIATRNSYEGMDAVKFLQGLEELPDAGHVVAAGKVGDLTADGLYAALSNRGNLMSYQHLEQLNSAGDETVGKGVLAQLWKKATESKPFEAVGGISEFRDHYFRLSHAAQFVIQNIDNTKEFKSLEELLDAASAHTRKWHPDGTDMSRAEQYFRLVIPFYSWQRKAIPLVIESMLTHPGRVISIPKVQYNMAVAMGVNPDSLSDPFPDDQLFPSYMTSQISGPIAQIDGKYYGINPGFAANDVLGDWLGAEPGRTALGSVSPLIRSPFEIAAGGQVGTGARINDTSDYLDSQIPGAAQVSRLTGNSVTGSLVSMLQGGGPDPQYQIAQGNKDPVAGPALSAINWLTGAGIQDMSQPNAINYAEIERRNAEGKKSGF